MLENCIFNFKRELSVVYIYIYIHTFYKLINRYGMLYIFYAGNELEFDYIPGSPKGPEHWGDLRPEWAACKNGKMQSPADLSANGRIDSVPKSQALTMSYRPSNATLKNRGYDIQVSLFN